MLEATDKQLLDTFSHGDSTAFEALFNRYHQRVFRAAYGLSGSHALAEDAAQEAFVALYRRPPILEPEASLLGWLCRVASNRSMNMLRSERREQARMNRMTINEVPDPAETALRAEDRTELRAALARLQERQIQILVLRYAGLSYADIAANIGVAPGSVGTLLARAERALVQTLTNMRQPIGIAEGPSR